MGAHRIPAMIYLTRLLALLRSMRLAIFLLGLLTIVAAVGTVGHDEVFHSVGFRALLGLLALMLAATLAQRRRWRFSLRSLGFILSHAGVLILMAGGLLGEFTGVKGVVELRRGEGSGELVLLHRGFATGQVRQLPFQVSLEEFQVERYPEEKRLYLLREELGGGREIVWSEDPEPGKVLSTPLGALRIGGPVRLGRELSYRKYERGVPAALLRLDGRPARWLGADEPERSFLTRDRELLVGVSRAAPDEAMLQQMARFDEDTYLSLPGEQGKRFMPAGSGFLAFLVLLPAEDRALEIRDGRVVRTIPLGVGGRVTLQLPSSQANIHVEDWLAAASPVLRPVESEDAERGYPGLKLRLPGSEAVTLLPQGMGRALGPELRLLYDARMTLEKDYRSRLRFEAPGEAPILAWVAVNEPVTFHGWSFYQQGWRADDLDWSRLLVNRDPGAPLVHGGLVLMSLGGLLAMAACRRRGGGA